MSSPDVDNRTEFEVHPQMLLHRSGERLVVVVKGTFRLDQGRGEPPLAGPEFVRPVRLADEMWGEPDVESVRYPSDLYVEKPGTDVVFVGTAFAPQRAPVPSFDAYLRVGPLSKAIRVFGLRVWEANGAGLSAPRPLESLDVRYDFAWGGRDLEDPARPVEEARNPVGRGVASHSAKLTHALAPQIEGLETPIRSASTRPEPAGLGAIGRSYHPRRSLVGTYDEQWKEWRAPLPPSDEDPRVAHFASPGLVAASPLAGGEECALLNLTPFGPLQFVLPKVALLVHFDVVRRERETFSPHLDTVLIDTWQWSEERPPVLEMTWRASVRAPRRMKDARIVVDEVMS